MVQLGCQVVKGVMHVWYVLQQHWASLQGSDALLLNMTSDALLLNMRELRRAPL